MNIQEGQAFESMEQLEKPVLLHTETSTGETILLYACPVSSMSRSVREAVVVFVVRQTTLRDRIQTLVGELDNDLYIYFGDQLMVSSTENQDLLHTMQESKPMLSPGGIRISVQNGMTVINTMSPKNRFQCIMPLPSIKFTQLVTKIRNLYIVILSILGVVCLALGAVFAYGNYRPIRRLAKSLESIDPAGRQQHAKNELDNIGTIISTTLTSNKEMHGHIREQNLILKHQMLTLLLNGNSAAIDTSAMNSPDIRMDGPYFCVLLIAPDAKDGQTHRLFHDDLVASVENEICSQGRLYMVEPNLEGYVSILCSLKSNQFEDRKAIAERLQGIYQCRQLKVKIGIGGVYDRVEKLNASFMEALSSLNGDISPAASVVFFEHLPSGNSQALSLYPLDELMYVLQAVRLGNEALAVEKLHERLEEIRKNVYSIMMQRCICFDIINSIIKTAMDLKVDIHPMEVSKVVNCENLLDYEFQMQKLIQRICGDVNERMQKRNHETANSVEEYIKEHFLDYDICLEKMSDRFGLSINHIGRIVKEKYGETFRDYIIILRVNEAKKLLSSGRLTVNEISARVGYTNVSHFIKTFKTYSGETPAQFRKNASVHK